jgi:phospholipase/carboxylesterase
VVAANPHLAPPVMFGAPIARARVVAILLHGRTQDPATMNDHVVRRIALDDIAYIAPAAADQSWYPAGFMAPLVDNEPRLSFALERIAQLADDFPHAVVIGFSQGACLACEHVYRRRTRPPAALIAFTGGLVGPPQTEWSDATSFAGMPVMLSGSLNDPFVPESRMRETAEVFTRLGARVTRHFYDGTNHEVSDAEITIARDLLAAL